MITAIQEAIEKIAKYEEKHGKPLAELEVTEEEYVALRKEAFEGGSYKVSSQADSFMGVKIKIKAS